MCGIFGIVTREEQALGPTLVEAGRMLSYRGYDTVGAATIHADGKIDMRKDVGKIEEVASHYNFKEMTGTRGILQLRWATFGAPSQINAQPHFDSDGDLVGAHNGNVVNNVELRQQFMAEGMIVRSENDGESCVHAVERYVNRGMEMIDALRHAYIDLEGDYAFVIGKQDDDKLYAIKKGSGLVVGLTNDAAVLSSDLPSVLPITRKILRVQDGEIAILWAGGAELRSVEDGALIDRQPEIVVETMESVQKGGYPHFMLKEINEQSTVAGELLHLLDHDENIPLLIERMRNARHLYFVACGTSYHACMVGAVYLSRLAGRPAIPVLAPQFVAQYANVMGPEDVGMFVSQSGETKDVMNAVKAAKARGAGILGMVNVIGSDLTLASEYWVPLACGYEISVPATKTYLNQVLAFLYLAMKMGGHDTAVLNELPAWIDKTIKTTALSVNALANQINHWNDLYILGYGLTYGVALEGALKLKEITYAHCEGLLSTEFKHGPLSAVSDGYPILFVAGTGDTDIIVSGINEVTCRGGHAVTFGVEDSRLRANASQFIPIPKTPMPELDALLAAIPLQMLSYQMSLGRGYDPDFPRNLSKTLTVD